MIQDKVLRIGPTIWSELKYWLVTSMFNLVKLILHIQMKKVVITKEDMAV